MKKITILFVTVLMITLTNPISAEDTGLSETISEGTTDVSYTLDESYTVTIPSSFTMDGNETSSNAKQATVVVSSKNIISGHCVAVKMSSNNDFKLKNGNKNIPYTIKVNNAEKTSGAGDVIVCVGYYDINEVGTGKTYSYLANSNVAGTSGTTALSFYFKEGAFANATLAGEYKDTLTFTCSIEELEKNK